ncbi:hypothetical protein [Cohaesibacter celericrescens]|uniref:hypothetical protein n=1 Tax=Cohaesibacter celericrescens TaxID=2067669 RepID=UPI001AEC8389
MTDIALKVDHIHQVAYRCKDAKQTVECYTKMFNMDFMLAIAEDHAAWLHVKELGKESADA